jgi:hypothetical protein
MSLASILNRLLPPALRPIEWATARYLRWSKFVVQTGPFRGLRYIDRACGSALAPKIAGTYERELKPFLDQLIIGSPDALVDVGAAEGYYAVGAAVAGWCQHIVAFESDPAARQAMSELMARNGVDASRIELRGSCTPVELEGVLARYQHPAVIMDVEGFEAFLLDPIRVPHLRTCRLLVEYHDFVLCGLRDEIVRRMNPTHAITAIEQEPRRADDLVCTDPLIRLLPERIRRRVLSEQRPFPHHGWLWMAPRDNPAG